MADTQKKNRPRGGADPLPPKHLSPPEERHQPEAETEAEAKAEADQGEESPPGEREGRSRVKTASGVVQGGGGSSILPYEGHFKSRPTGDKGGKGVSLQVPVRRVVAACSRADSLGSLRRIQASKEFSLDAAGRHSFTSSEVNSHPSESTYRRPLPSGRMVTKGEMGLLEPPGQARFYSNKDCNRGTRIKVDPKKGGTSVSTPSAVEKRIYNSPARDPQLSRNPRQDYSSSRSIFRGMGKRRHSDSRYPRNPRRCLCQSPVHGSQRRCGRTSNSRLVYNELVHRYPKYQDGARYAMTAVTSSLRNLLSPFCKDKFLEQSLIQDPSSRPGPDDGALLWPRWSQGRGKATASRFIFPLSDEGEVERRRRKFTITGWG